MPLDRRYLVSAAFAAIVLSSGSAMAANQPLGVWMNDTGRGAVEIKQCGDNLCGHVVWVKDTSDTKGCGRQILGEVKPVGSNTWDNGWVYSPERKKKYDVELKPLSDGTLRVKGYAGTKLFSRTMIWKPAPDDLVRCSTETASTKTAPASETKTAAASEVKTASKTEPAPVAETKKPVEEEAPAAEAPADDAQEVASEDTEIEDKLGKFFKKGSDGNCKIDLPWVKLDIKCDGKE